MCDSKYILHRSNRDVNKFIVTIVGDAGDEDFITSVEEYKKSEFERSVLDRLIDLKKNYSGHYKLREYENSGYLNIPYDGDGMCNTLEEIIIKYVDENGLLWEVELDLGD